MVSAICASSLDVLVTSGAAKLTRSIGEIYWIFLGRLNPIVRKPVLPFKFTSVSRGLRRVFLSTIRNLASTVLRVLSRGQNYRFRITEKH